LGIELVSVHTKMPKKMNIVFAKQPSNLGGGGLGPLGYFGLPMMDLGRPPLPPNIPYC
jgi:hypothetical protein